MPQERILLHSGFYGVLLPDGKRMLEKPPIGQIVEGNYPLPQNADAGAGGESMFFRVLNVDNQHYVVQYSPNKYPIVLKYVYDEGMVLDSFEKPGSTVGIAGAGVNMGHVNGWVPESLWATGRAAEAQNPVVGQTQPAFPTPIISDPRTPYVPTPPPENTAPPFVPYQPPAAPVTGTGGSSGGGASVAPGTGVYEPGEYYATPQQTSLPPETQPAAIDAGALAVGAAVLFFLMGDDNDN